MPDLEGKVAFITGAARGQGRSHAIKLAEAGASIIAVDLCEQIDGVPYEMSKPEDLEETIAAVEALDRPIVARVADVRDYSALEAAVSEGTSQLGPLNIAVANAGICSFGPLAEMSETTWQTMIDVNLTGIWHTAKAALTNFEDGGSLIFTSSTAGLKGYPSVGHYTAAKHGMVGLMRSFAQELGPRGIRVNTVHPTQVETDMLLNEGTYKMFRPDLEDPQLDDFKEASEAVLLLPTPWVQSKDISAAVLFLASDESRYITGVTLPVDAGNLVK